MQALMAQANNFGLGSLAQQLLDKFGPLLGQLLLEWLIKKSQQSAMAFPAAFDIRGMIAALVERYLPDLIDEAAASLTAQGTFITGILGSLLANSKQAIIDSILKFLETPAALAAISKAGALPATP